MKKASSKKVTTDELAVMINNGFQRVENRLSSVENELQEFKDFSIKKFDQISEDFVTVRRDIMNSHDKFPSNYAFDQLSMRVVVLEDNSNSGKTGKRK
jgi:predicted Zn-dependent protease with MMP-like domain